MLSISVCVIFLLTCFVTFISNRWVKSENRNKDRKTHVGYSNKMTWIIFAIILVIIVTLTVIGTVIGLEGNLFPFELENAVLEEMDLREFNLWRANLNGANLENALLCKVNLSEANLSDADFRDAVLILTNFTGADLKDAKFDGANLTSANFKGAKNLTVDQLAKAKTLLYVQFDQELEKQIRKKYPHLLEI